MMVATDPAPSRLLLAESNPDAAHALTLFLSQQPRLRLLANVNRMCMLNVAMLRLKPDLLLLDWDMPDFAPPVDVWRMRVCRPGLRIIALGARLETERQALAEGADACVGKSEGPGQLLATIMRFCNLGVPAQVLKYTL